MTLVSFDGVTVQLLEHDGPTAFSDDLLHFATRTAYRVVSVFATDEPDTPLRHFVMFNGAEVPSKVYDQGSCIFTQRGHCMNGYREGAYAPMFGNLLILSAQHYVQRSTNAMHDTPWRDHNCEQMEHALVQELERKVHRHLSRRNKVLHVLTS